LKYFDIDFDFVFGKNRYSEMIISWHMKGFIKIILAVLLINFF